VRKMNRTDKEFIIAIAVILLLAIIGIINGIYFTKPIIYKICN
jgi:hypothetical protein